MRSLWFSLALLAAIGTAAAVDSLFMLKGVGYLEEVCEKIEAADTVEEDDAKEARRIFDKYRALFSVSVSMEAVDGMENALLLLESAAKSKSASETSEALVSFRYAIYRLRDAAIPTPESVF